MQKNILNSFSFQATESKHNTILDRAGAGAGRRHGGGEGGGQGHHRKLHEAAAPLPGGGRGGHEEPDVSVAVLLLQTKLRI